MRPSPCIQFDLADSPIDSATIKGQHFYIKRDDQLNPDFNGNKARKFLYYLHLQQPEIQSIVSYGGNQSNAMMCLSGLAKLKVWRFDYYLKKLPEHLKTNPVGNFKNACENGMQYHEVTLFPTMNTTSDCIVIPQGGRCAHAEYGIRMLADEINQWVTNQQIEDCSLFLPSGTGTTAFYLQQHTLLPVFTTPCIGDSKYLKEQWDTLRVSTKRYPLIIEPNQKNRFGKPGPEYLTMWNYLLETTGIEFDLLYDPLGWITILKHRHRLTQNVIYIHCGGISGNQSMLDRYKHLSAKQ